MATVNNMIVNGSLRVSGTIYGELEGSATHLATGRTFRTNLASTSTATFDGTANVTPGVTGTLAVENGGTGLTAAPSLLVNLASTSAVGIFAASPRPGVTGTLPLAHGGTGATTAAAALTNLGLTATAAELNYCDGVTSAIQTQINNCMKFVSSGTAPTDTSGKTA